jgi:hypothetical protein
MLSIGALISGTGAEQQPGIRPLDCRMGRLYPHSQRGLPIAIQIIFAIRFFSLSFQYMFNLLLSTIVNMVS